MHAWVVALGGGLLSLLLVVALLGLLLGGSGRVPLVRDLRLLHRRVLGVAGVLLLLVVQVMSLWMRMGRRGWRGRRIGGGGRSGDGGRGGGMPDEIYFSGAIGRPEIDREDVERRVDLAGDGG